ncbi:MAG: alkaline phosphatase family protein, partial [Pseudomonadota bacterium]|nr:alkaline phosphatase family protein [Pseudomonadota bacterium]
NLIDSPPIWVLAEQEGITTGVYFWVGSETQWNGWQAKYKYAPFDANIKEEEKIDQVIEWLEMDEAIRPKLIMTYWDGTDSVGHIYGTDHKKIFDQMVRQDQMLGLLFSRLTEIHAWDYVTLLLVSDHGMINVNKYISLKDILESIEIDYILSSGPAVAHIFIDDKAQRDEALELLSRQDHMIAFSRENLPASFHMNHPTRTGDLIVTTEPPYMFNNNPMDGPKGMHGYDPDLREMHAIFGAVGAGVRNERIGPIHMTDVAPTIAKLLGIKSVNHMQGRAIDLSPKD